MDTDRRLDLTIRRLEGQAEADACARMMSASEPWVTLQRSYEDSLRLLSDPQREVYVAVEPETLAGFLILLMHGAFTGYIQTVCVAPGMRNRGVGGRLLDFAEERIWRDSPNVFLCVSSFNPAARRPICWAVSARPPMMAARTTEGPAPTKRV